MIIKLNKKKAKYNCVIEEIDNKQKIDLKNKIDNTSSLEPWLLTFLDRFCKLANKQNLSKKDISDGCQSAKLQKPHLKGHREILPPSTLSSITNPESDNIRLPNVNHLIALSKFFNVSLDYFVGLSDCQDSKNNSAKRELGLTEKTIRTLMLYNRMLSLPEYSPFPESGFPVTPDGNIDYESFPSIDKDGFYSKYYYGKDSYSKNDIIKEMDEVISEFPDFFSETPNYELAKKKEIFDHKHPSQHIFETLELLLTYNDGTVINMLSEYLSISKTQYNPINSSIDESSQEALLLSKIHSELIRIHDLKKADI